MKESSAHILLDTVSKRTAFRGAFLAHGLLAWSVTWYAADLRHENCVFISIY